MAPRRREKNKLKKAGLPRRLFRKERAVAFPPGVTVIRTPEGQEKMSEVLEEFIEPFRTEDMTDSAYRSLLNLAVLAWNAALLPAGEKREKIYEALEESLVDASEGALEFARVVIGRLIQRKEKDFAKNRRAIISYKLRETADGYHLSVASTL